MSEAIGVLETCGIPSALVAADWMAKAANIQILGLENTDQGRMSVIIQGQTGEVQTALVRAIAELQHQPGTQVIGHHCIPCPADMADAVLRQWRQANLWQDCASWLDDE